MEGPWRVLMGTGVLLSLLHAGSAMRCTRENFWGQTEHFLCPDDGNPENRFCCGFGDNKFCCSNSDEELIEDIVEKLPTILGVLAVIVVSLIVLCVVCCCCCPFCLLYKKRQRGTVHNPANPDVSVMQPLQNQPQSYAPPPQAAPYPAQPAPYPTQPAPYPTQPAPYPTQPGYAPQPYPPQGYPAEQPPMYTEKQPPPYNPTY